MSGAQRWLWITAELPTELTTGRLVYSAHLAEALGRAGIEITMVGLGDAPPETHNLTWKPVSAELRGGLRSLLSPLPNLSYACAVEPLRADVSSLLAESWDVVVVDHLQTAWAMAEVSERHRGPIVFVTHNFEAGVRRRVAAEASFRSGRRFVLAFDAWKSARLERAAAATADIVTSITEDDRRELLARAPSSRHVVVAPAWSGAVPPAPPPMSARPRRVAILGSFDWHVKQENLRRFLPVADPLFRDAGIELVVGGRVPDDFRSEIESGLTATRFVGWVDDPTDFLSDCRLGVIAEPLGGGFKMKALDYVFHRVVIASLAGSVAGVPLRPGDSILESDTIAGLAATIVEEIDRTDRLDRLAADALAACREEFSWDRRTVELIESVATFRTP